VKKSPNEELPEGFVMHELRCSNCNELFDSVPIPVDMKPDRDIVCIKCLRDRDLKRFKEVTGRRSYGK
jgi:hypothetical protein